MSYPHNSQCLQHPRPAGPKLGSEGRWLIFPVLQGEIRENPHNPQVLDTQNKPIFSRLRIAVSHCKLRTQDSGLKSQASSNKAIQTHFLEYGPFSLIIASGRLYY